MQKVFFIYNDTTMWATADGDTDGTGDPVL